jgi:nucleotide-binding universal stress UspA family protein
MDNGERLLNDDVLNGTVVMILFTCIISSLVTERSARRFATDEAVTSDAEKNKRRAERILIPVANPETIENLINLGLVIKDAKQKTPLIALNVINDTNNSQKQEMRGKRNLERAAQTGAAADTPVTMVSRYDISVSSGIIHTVQEYDATDIVLGLHWKENLVDSFFGRLAENLLKGTHREVMIAKFLMPVNTLRRIVVAVPPKAEYETGFPHWVGHLCRMGSLLGCRVHFFASRPTITLLQHLVRKRHAGTPTEFSPLDEWGDLLLLTNQVNYDHVLVVVSARRGSISYDPSFERLPGQLGKYFANNSLIILYPEQGDEPQEIVSFSDPRGHNESQHYEQVGKWLYKWFKKN